MNYWEDGWKDEQGETVTLNKERNYFFHKETVLKNIVPKIGEDTVLNFTSKNQQIEVAIDGNRIYENGLQNTGPLSRMSGDVNCMVALKKEYEGKEITITIRNVYDNANCVIGAVVLDCGNRVLLSILQKGVFTLAFGSLGFLIGICFFIIALRGRRAENQYNSNEFLHLGIAMMLSPSWVLVTSRAVQFLTSNMAALLSWVYVYLLKREVIKAVVLIIRFGHVLFL